MAIPEFHVLLIEDSQSDARILSELLACAKTARFIVESADRLATGSEHLSRGDFDVVLLDLGLPDSQGLGTFVEIHARSPELPVVVMSSTTRTFSPFFISKLLLRIIFPFSLSVKIALTHGPKTLAVT